MQYALQNKITMIKLTKNILVGLISLTAATSFGQYQAKEWANFEDGAIPAGSVRIGGNVDTNASVIAATEATTQSEVFRNNPEIGKSVLRLRSTPSKLDSSTWQTGIAVGETLDRSSLGTKGRALIQADFYIEEDGAFPDLAVLAMEPPDANAKTIPSVKKAFYRFGITLGKRLYFSAVYPKEEKARIFEQDNKLLEQIPRPGWHRFSIVFEGTDTIRCYVDGREASFSPIQDSGIKEAMVGVLLASKDRDPYNAYVDNLSIQVSDDAPALPSSPYNDRWKIAAGSSVKARRAGANTVTPVAQTATALAVDWQAPAEAWKKAQAEKKGLLLYFYAPGVSRVESMNNLLNNDPGAKSFIARHSCARIDVNQLEGGSIAKKYNVFKVPTLLVISPDAQKFKMVAPNADDSWASIEAQLGGI